MRTFKDERYSDRIFTERELHDEYEQLRLAGETELSSFEDYLNACIDLDGTLYEVYKCEDCGQYVSELDVHDVNNKLRNHYLLCDFCLEHAEQNSVMIEMKGKTAKIVRVKATPHKGNWTRL